MNTQMKQYMVPDSTKNIRAFSTWLLVFSDTFLIILRCSLV